MRPTHVCAQITRTAKTIIAGASTVIIYLGEVLSYLGEGNGWFLFPSPARVGYSAGYGRFRLRKIIVFAINIYISADGLGKGGKQ